MAQIAASIREWGWTAPILIDPDGGVIAGHGRLLAAQSLGVPEVPVIVASGWTDAQRRAYVIADNQLAVNAGWDETLLRVEIGGLDELGFDTSLLGFGDELAGLLADPDPEPEDEAPRVTLAERFGIPPFSVMNAREGWWQERKRAWLALGIQSELGRGEQLIPNGGGMESKARYSNGKTAARTFGQDLMRGEHTVGERAEKIPHVKGNGWGGGVPRRDAAFYVKKRAWEKENGREISTTEFREKYWDGAAPADTRAIQTQDWVRQKIAEGDIEGGMAAGHTGTSIFDPVLCELAYRWFCPPGGMILDPFAGGSVRGVVASKLGRAYLGIDLSARQIAANAEQAERICAAPAPRWINGDSRDVATLAAGQDADFLFTCPPYADLEIYSDDPRDLSTLPYADFIGAYREIIANSCALLKEDRFACIVVGEARGKDGAYYGFVPDTIAAFQAAGLKLYNEAILVTAAGSLPIRAAKQFEATRKLGKTHQNVLVFVKGDARKATAAIGPVEFGAIEDEGEAEESEPEPARWKVSAKWLAKRHDCTLAGITHRCHGACCKSPAYWPPRAFEGANQCGRLGPQGCTFADDDKPITCHLYPLKLNKNGTLILHNRTTLPTGICKGNHGNGPPIIEAMENNLVAVFGRDQYERVRADVLAGRDSYFEPAPDILAAMAREHDWEEQNIPPEPRGEARTPIERHGEIWLKRDDLFKVAGVPGGKVRTCWRLAQGARGLVTAGSRSSPQINIVAHIGRSLGVPVRAHAPTGELSPELIDAQRQGAEIIQHSPGYNSVIVARARADAKARGWREIPFGMECREAVEETASQIADIPDGVKRIVVPVGSGMSLAGILAGLERAGLDIPVIGIVVGADPEKRLDRYAPEDWRQRAQLIPAGVPYDSAVEAVVGGVRLDPHYEAKCARFLEPGDLLWIVGIRATET